MTDRWPSPWWRRSRSRTCSRCRIRYRKADLAPESGGTLEEDPAPVPQPTAAAATAAGTGGPILPAAAPCDRVYNERDCCKDEQKCGTARQHWQRDALAKISLDITPKLRPDVDDAFEERSERNADLTQAPVRTWRDRQGNVLATGRLTNVQQGRLLVLDANNQVVKVPWDDLCDDDLCFVTAWWRIPTECTFGGRDVRGTELAAQHVDLESHAGSATSRCTSRSRSWSGTVTPQVTSCSRSYRVLTSS